MEFDLSDQIEEEISDFDKQFMKIIEKLQQKEKLEAEKIFLCGNQIDSNQIALLVNALAAYKNLKVLDLSRNKVQASSMPNLKKIIDMHPKLECVVLNFNQINDTDFKVLVDNLTSSRVLNVEINLACNEITKASLPSAQELLSPSSVLSILNGNYMSEQDGEKFRIFALQKLNTLTTNAKIVKFSVSDSKKSNSEKEKSDQVTGSEKPQPSTSATSNGPVK